MAIIACKLDLDKDVFLIIILVERDLPKFGGICFKYTFLSTLLYVALCFFMCAVFAHLMITRLLIQFKLLEYKLVEVSEVTETMDTYCYYQRISQKLRSCVLQHVCLMRLLHKTHCFLNNCTFLQLSIRIFRGTVISVRKLWLKVHICLEPSQSNLLLISLNKSCQF